VSLDDLFAGLFSLVYVATVTILTALVAIFSDGPEDRY
jgi:hypothetical protein